MILSLQFFTPVEVVGRSMHTANGLLAVKHENNLMFLNQLTTAQKQKQLNKYFTNIQNKINITMQCEKSHTFIRMFNDLFLI